MTHAHNPEFTFWDEFSEDGITTSRRGVLGVSIPRYTPTPAAAAARNEVARPVTLARAPEQSELLREAHRIFDAMGTHLPQRINTEELGDALEDLQNMEREGKQKWRLQARILRTLFWVCAHTAQDGVHSLIEMETPATGNNGKSHE